MCVCMYIYICVHVYTHICIHAYQYPIAFGLPATVPWIARPVTNKLSNLLGHLGLQVGGYVGHVGSSWPQVGAKLGSSWAILGPSWGILASKLGDMGVILAQVGGSGGSWAQEALQEPVSSSKPKNFGPPGTPNLEAKTILKSIKNLSKLMSKHYHVFD